MKHILHIWFIQMALPFNVISKYEYKNWIIIGNFLSLIIEVFLDILKQYTERILHYRIVYDGVDEKAHQSWRTSGCTRQRMYDDVRVK